MIGTIQAQPPVAGMIDEKTVRVDVDQFGEVSEGFVIVTKNGKNALMDLSGRIVLDYDAQYTPYGKSFKDGWLAVQDVVTKKFGFIDSTLKLVVPCTLPASDYNELGRRFDFSTKPPQRILLKTGAHIDLRTPTLADVKAPVHPMEHLGYSYAVPRSHLEGGIAAIDHAGALTGNVVRFEVVFKENRPPSAEAKESSFAKQAYYGFCDLSGKVIVQPVYSSSGEYDIRKVEERTFTEGRRWVRKRMEDDTYRWLLIDTTGSRIGELSFRYAPSSFQSGFALIVGEEATSGVVDLSGRIVHEFKISDADHYKMKQRIEEYLIGRRFLGDAGPWTVVEKFNHQGKAVFWCEPRFNVEAAQRMLQPPINTCVQPSAVVAKFDHRLNGVVTGDIDAAFQVMNISTGIGVIDGNANWIIAPVFRNLSRYAPEAQLVYTEVDYNASTPGMNGKEGKLQGFMDHCGKFRLLKAEKSKW